MLTAHNSTLTEDTWTKVLPQDIWIEIASFLSPEDLENYKLVCKSFLLIGQSDKISKSSHDLLYNRLRKLDPSLPKALPDVGFKAQYQQDLNEVTQKINAEIAYLREHHPKRVEQFIDTLKLEHLAPLQRLEKISNALDDLNIEIIEPFIDINSTELDLTSKKITRIPQKLIEDVRYQSFWLNLRKLMCGYNRLTTLNLQGLAALERLSCFRNKLITLDVQGLATLKSLYCDQNRLTTLNLQGLAALEILDCYQNHLTDLNVQGLYELEMLDCSHNKLTVLSNELIAKFGEQWARNTLTSQARPVLAAADMALLAPTAAPALLVQQNMAKVRKRKTSAKEEQEVTMEADAISTLHPKKPKAI